MFVTLLLCIARMIYLSIPGVVLLLSIQAIVYRVTKVSLYNEFVKAMLKEA